MTTSTITKGLIAIVIVVLIAMSDAIGSSKPQDNATKTTGREIYEANCLACHQADGGGVPMMAPPLIKTSYVLGDKSRLIGIVLNGFDEEVEIEGEYYSNPMPAFPQLSDKEVADVLSYIRSNFENSASTVSAAEVKVERERMAEEK